MNREIGPLARRALSERDMSNLRSFLVVSSSLVFFVACSKPSPEEQKKKEAELAAALASAMGAPPPSSASSGAGGGAGAAAAKPGEFVGSCTDNESKICNEFSGALPMGAEDSCKMLNGVFSKTARCPTDKMGTSPLAGICTIKAEGDDRVKKSHSYQVGGTTVKATAESAKMMCDLQSGVFAAAAAAPAASPAAPAKAAAAIKKK